MIIDFDPWSSFTDGNVRGSSEVKQLVHSLAVNWEKVYSVDLHLHLGIISAPSHSESALVKILKPVTMAGGVSVGWHIVLYTKWWRV